MTKKKGFPNTLKTPGVYIDETNAFPNSVVGVETSVPAFIGYTEKAEFEEKSLLKTPVQIDSLMDYERFFGSSPITKYSFTSSSDSDFTADVTIDGENYVLDVEVNAKNFKLFDSLKFFYQNGGGTCFIISVGTYGGEAKTKISRNDLEKGITLLEKEAVPTILVIPDAMSLKSADCYGLQRTMLRHCGEQMNRVAILDIHEGYKNLDDLTDNPVKNFRDNVSSDFLSYGAAYYPWLHTTIVQPSEVNYKNLNKEGLQTLMNICKDVINKFPIDKQKILINYINLLLDSDNNINIENEQKGPSVDEIHNGLYTQIEHYKTVMTTILKKKNLIAPAAAMAGIYSLVDSQRGVWKAPANVAVSSVISPAVLIDHNQQQDLNAPILGKAICAIRPFIELGTMVWGARTLDGNSLDWRYINVRRTMIMMEQSIKLALRAYVFEPNVKNTWVSVKAMITNFLTNLWKLGALAGSVPEDAFSVNIGLGTTMTAVDILEGKMIVEVKVAVSRPAEFIVVTFEQQMQKS